MRRRALLLALGLLAVPGADADVTDGQVYGPVNYFTRVPPSVGQSDLDPGFGTAIRRLSDARNQPNSADTGYLAFIANEYATMSPFNLDDSRLLLQHQSYFALYDGEGRYVKDLPFEISAASEPRWSRSDRDLLYYLHGNSLKSYDTAREVGAVVHTFVEYSGVSGRGESDICFDGDHFVLVGDGHDIFVYELSTDTKGPALDAAGHALDSVYIAPGDGVIVSWLQAGTGPFSGIELFDRDMQFLRQLAPVGGHMDVTRDTDGEPVLLWINAADPQAPPGCPNAVVKIRLADAQQTCLLRLDWGLAVHLSAPDGGAWFYVSTYAPGDPSPFLGGWRRFTNELLQVRLDGSVVRRLAHHRSRPFNDYWYTPRAAVSRDGRRLVFTSNYGLPWILGYPKEYADAYLVDLETVAPSYPGSQAAASTRYEQDHASVTYGGSWYPNALPIHSGDSAVLAMNAGAYCRLTFSGNTVRWIGYRDEWAGIARVSVDGQAMSTVDTYATPAAAQTVLFAAPELPAGSHVLEIEVTGTRNPASGGTWVWVDALEASVRRQQDDPAVSYAGDWHPHASLVHSGGSAVLAMDPGSRATFSFSGSTVSWIGYRDEWSGIARVSIDGSVRADIDTYAAPFEARTIVYTLSGLPSGAHTLAIEATGRRHPLSRGSWVWVDAFDTPAEAAP